MLRYSVRLAAPQRMKTPSLTSSILLLSLLHNKNLPIIDPPIDNVILLYLLFMLSCSQTVGFIYYVSMGAKELKLGEYVTLCIVTVN